MMTQTEFCSHLSRSAGEQIFGTAGNGTDVWFVLEYPGVWGGKAMEESRLDDALKAHLQRGVAETPGSRLQLIKRGEQRNGSLSFFICLSGEDEAALYRFKLADFSDLAAMELPAMVAEMRAAPERYAANRHDEPLFLVCTNGSRDRCCATFGVPVYLSMATYAGEGVWQTTHTGGHRFAPTMICLPHGLFYGRIGVEDVTSIVDSYAAGNVYDLDRYRGRSCFRQPVQAADYYLRAETQQQALDAFSLLGAEQEDDVWACRFSSNGDGLVHELFVQMHESEFANPLSCRKPDTERVPQFRLLSYAVRGAVPA
jgi:hypothetical protein